MDRPWWLLAFLLPLCCGGSLLAFLFGLGGSGLLGSLFVGAVLLGPWGALVSGSLLGVSVAVPLIVVADRGLRRQGAACEKP